VRAQLVFHSQFDIRGSQVLLATRFRSSLLRGLTIFLFLFIYLLFILLFIFNFLLLAYYFLISYLLNFKFGYQTTSSLGSGTFATFLALSLLLTNSILSSLCLFLVTSLFASFVSSTYSLLLGLLALLVYLGALMVLFAYL